MFELHVAETADGVRGVARDVTEIRATAARLLTTVRDADVVARHGGDEFVVVYEGADDDAVRSLVERIRNALCAAIDIGGGVTVRCGAGVGLADTRSTTPTASALIGAADRAMLEVKKQHTTSPGMTCEPRATALSSETTQVRTRDPLRRGKRQATSLATSSEVLDDPPGPSTRGREELTVSASVQEAGVRDDQAQGDNSSTIWLNCAPTWAPTGAAPTRPGTECNCASTRPATLTSSRRRLRCLGSPRL